MEPLDKIDDVIYSMCVEISNEHNVSTDWKNLSEAELLKEAIICILSSQTVFELAVETTEILTRKGILKDIQKGSVSLEKKLHLELLKSIPFQLRGESRKSKLRFPNRVITILLNNSRNIYQNGLTLCDLLHKADTSYKARELLIKNVVGMGPKQASLFLRRVGYCAELAVLDVHIIDYLYLKGLVQNSRIGTLKKYEEIESVFVSISKKLGFKTGIVDLATWITIRAAKKESLV